MDTPGEVALVLLGALLVLLAVVDAVLTTLGAGLGGGPLTLRLAHLTGAVLRLAGRGAGRPLLSLSGPLVLLVTVLTWVLLLWAGWTLVLSGAELAVVDSTSGVPAGWVERAYFAGYVLFTLGLGDFRPETGGWQLLTALASFVGLFLITLSITYLVSVVSAAVSRRALAREVGLSGGTGAEVVLLHWDGEQVGGAFSPVAQSLGSQVLAVAEQHLAYPVLHSFSAADPRASAPRALAALDDAVLLLRSGLQPSARPPAAVLTRLERALLHHAHTAGGSGGGHCSPPPVPALQPLREAGLPVVEESAYQAAVEQDGPRRARLRALVEADGHTWPEVRS